MVKRYSIGADGTDPNGDLVKYEDYAALESRCTAKDEKLRMINELIDAAEQVNKLAQEATERLIQERNALAAENAGLNQKMNKLATWPGIEFYSSAWAFSGVDGDTALEFMCDVQTPATDAFLAEVRAQGVDSAINTVIAMMNHQHPVTSKAIDILRVHAAQLRKGVQS